MRVHELVADAKLISLNPRQTALEAAQLMGDEGIGSVIVLEPDGELAGIFTERDLMRRVVAPGIDPAKTPLRDVMTRELFTTAPDRAVVDVRREMQERHIRHVPVLDESGKVLAVLGMRDLLRADLREKRRAVEDMTAYIRGEGPDA